jgi:hypothetical protein
MVGRRARLAHAATEATHAWPAGRVVTLSRARRQHNLPRFRRLTSAPEGAAAFTACQHAGAGGGSTQSVVRRAWMCTTRCIPSGRLARETTCPVAEGRPRSCVLQLAPVQRPSACLPPSAAMGLLDAKESLLCANWNRLRRPSPQDELDPRGQAHARRGGNDSDAAHVFQPAGPPR